MGHTAIPHAHYVALIRVTAINGLHIINLNAAKITVTQTVTTEMELMKKDAMLQLCYTPLYMFPSDKLTITFQNCRSYHRHNKDLKSDNNIISSHIICLAETRLLPSDTQYDIDEFVTKRNDQVPTSNYRPPHGLAVLIRENLQYASAMTYKFTSDMFECIIVFYKNQYQCR